MIDNGSMHGRLLALMLAGIVVLAGCAAPAGGGAGGAGAAAETKDRITASDEPDASRRARVRLELAGAYFSRGQMTVALDEVKLAIAADPNLSEAFNLRGLIYANLGDEALAEQSFRRALQLNARDFDTMHNFGWYLCQRKRYPEANELFAQALTVPQIRDPSRTLLAQGVCQALGGRLEDAERTLQKSFEIDPANPATAVNLAEVLYRRGDFERARFYVRRVNVQPEVSNAQTLWLAARIEKRLGNEPGAEDFGRQLRSRFAGSREAAAFEKGQFDD